MTEYSIDWRLIVGSLAISAALVALIAWQARGTPDKCRNWLGFSALSLEALAMAMAVFWAIKQGGGILTVFFALGFIGLALSKAVTVSALVSAWSKSKYPAFAVIMLALAGAYSVVYFAGVFEGTLHSATKHSVAAQASAPVRAINADIENTRAKLANLSVYADADKAAVELQKIAQVELQNKKHHQSLQPDINSAKAGLLRWATSTVSCEDSGVVSDAHVRRTSSGAPYTSKAREACEKLHHLLTQAALSMPTPSSNYSDKHNAYLGVRAHLAELEQQRARLLSSGATSHSVATADDSLIAWLFNLPIDKAAGIKWLLFVAIFDVLSLLLRLGGDLLLGRDVAGEYAKRLRALIESGIAPDDAARIMATKKASTTTTNDIPPAQAVPSLDTGGRIITDGLAHVHSDEVVLNAGAVAELDSLYPKLLDTLNAKHRKEGAASTGAASTGAASTGTATVQHHYHNMERVPPELSQKAGKGRVGKIDVCKDCGGDFVVKTYNGTRCKSCAGDAESSYRKFQIRKSG